nr:MAG TPA: hypothetical protein [Caudoviricetes sp.]
MSHNSYEPHVTTWGILWLIDLYHNFIILASS